MKLMQRLVILIGLFSQLNMNGLTLSDANIEAHKVRFVADDHKSKLLRIGVSLSIIVSSAGGLYWWWSVERQEALILGAAVKKLYDTYSKGKDEDKIKDTLAALLQDKKDDSWQAWLKWIGFYVASIPMILVRKEISDLAYRLSNPYIRQFFKLPGARLLVLPPHAQAYLSYHSHAKTVINEIETKVNQNVAYSDIAQWLDESGSAALLMDSLEKIVGYCEAALPKLRNKQAEYNRALQLVLELRAIITLFDPYAQPDKARAFYVDLESKIRTLTDLQTIN